MFLTNHSVNAIFHSVTKNVFIEISMYFTKFETLPIEKVFNFIFHVVSFLLSFKAEKAAMLHCWISRLKSRIDSVYQGTMLLCFDKQKNIGFADRENVGQRKAVFEMAALIEQNCLLLSSEASAEEDALVAA